MAVLPGSLALTTIPDGALATAADLRNNFTAIQTEANALLTVLAGGSAGQVLTGVGTTLTWAGSYAAYTTTWAASGAAPAIGNGTLVGRYAQIGKHVHFTIQLTAGTTTTFGTGAYSFSLPATPAGPSVTVVGAAFAFDVSASSSNTAVVVLTGGNINIHYPATWPSGVDTVYGQTTPWTWATSDTMNISGVYEAA